MALTLSPTNFLQTDGYPSRLRLPPSDSESMALSRRVQHSYKCSSNPAGRLSISDSSLSSTPYSSPPSFQNSGLPEDYSSSSRKSRKSRRNSESIPHSVPEQWQNEDGLENRLESLALVKTPKRNPTKLVRDSFNGTFAAEGFHHYPDPPLSDLAVPLTISDWDSVAIYKTAPSHGHCGSGASSGVSRESNRSGRRKQQAYGYGDFPSGGRGRAGGDDDGEQPSLPQPIEPPASDGKKYYACWFWLYDPVRYHSCGDIRKEAHHLKHVHLPRHFPNGLPSALKHRMNYDAVWYVLFPGHELPDIKDRDERLLDMARQYRSSANSQSSMTTISGGRRDSGLLSPDMARNRERRSGQPARSRRHSLHNRPGSRFGSSSTGGRSTRDSSSNGSSWFDPSYDYISQSQDTAHTYNEECDLIPDGDSISQPLAMFLDYDGQTVMSPTEDMEIDNMTRAPSVFYPINPRIKVVDALLGEAYFWDERHLDTDFDFNNHYLVHFGGRTTGADMLVSMTSMEVLQREYLYNLKPRANSDGFVTIRKVHRSAGWPS